MRRILLACALGIATAGGVWAVPADGGESATVPEIVPSPRPDRASTELATAHQLRPDVSSVASPEAVPTAVPAHLTSAAPITAVEPTVIVTTTTSVAAAPTPPLPSPIPEPAVAVAFTAGQAYGSCSEPVPYDVFSGTGPPGSTVTISSSFGSGSTTADADGQWQHTVEFPTAPRGETFPVTLGAAGGSTVLSFTATGGDTHA